MFFNAITSVALGVPGKYSFFGIPVTFIDNGATPINKLSFGVLRGMYINTFVHELGHSLAFKHICGVFGEIFVNSDASGYCTIKKWRFVKATDLERTILALAGPLLQVSFGLLTSLMTHKIYAWSSKHNDSFSYKMVIATLKIRNICSVFYQMFNVIDFFTKLQKIPIDMSDDTGLMQIYRSTGALGVSLSSALILSIGFLAFKIIFLQPKVTEKPAPLTFYEKVIAQLRHLIFQVNLVAMGVMKSVIDVIGFPLVDQVNIKGLR